jgi:hypothetical protein
MRTKTPPSVQRDVNAASVLIRPCQSLQAETVKLLLSANDDVDRTRDGEEMSVPIYPYADFIYSHFL